MRSTWMLALALGLAMPAAAAAPDLKTAVSAPGRPADAVKLDDSRKPADVLAFLRLQRGMATADLITGSGYWAEILARSVGPKGTVTAFEPNQFYTSPEEQQTLKALQARQPGIRLVRYPFEAFTAAPASFDFAIISMNYHDLYWTSETYHIPRTDPAAFLKTLYAAMKPGGIVGVIDHAGLAGDTRAIVDQLHRIDPATVQADFRAAGFVLAAQSPLLANPADDHSKLVFDPAIRGRTDRFLYRFRKPS